jgi:hypothetical protein
VPKSKGCWKDPIQKNSFISLIFPCVCFWLGRIWLRDSCLVALSTFGFFVKMNEWKFVWEHAEIHHLFWYMVRVDWRIVLWFKLNHAWMRNENYFAQFQQQNIVGQCLKWRFFELWRMCFWMMN